MENLQLNVCYIENIIRANSTKLNHKSFEGYIIRRSQFQLILCKAGFTSQFFFPYFSVFLINTKFYWQFTGLVFRSNGPFYGQFDQTQCL